MEKLFEMIDKGSVFHVYFPEDSSFVVGGYIHVKENWIVLFPIFPTSENEYHDVLVSNLKTSTLSAIFNDQQGRECRLYLIEPYEEEERKVFDDYRASINRAIQDRYFAEILAMRQEDPEQYVGRKM